MGFLKSIISGAVLGITEGLPISSAGHVVLMGHIFGQSESFRSVFYILHIGVLIAIISAYYKTIFGFVKSFFYVIKDIFTGQFSFKSLDKNQNMLVAACIGLLPMLLIFVPVVGSGTNVLGIAREFFDSCSIILMGVSFLISGVLLQFGINSLESDKFKYTYKTSDNMVKRWDGRMKITPMDAIWCGVFQFIAMIFPGISHIGAVFSIGVIRGINRQLALEYTFLLGVPSIIVMIISEFLFATKCTDILCSEPAIWMGIICSAIFGFLFIKVFNRLVKKNRVFIFSIYTFLIGFAMIALGVWECFQGVNVFSGKTL